MVDVVDVVSETNKPDLLSVLQCTRCEELTRIRTQVVPFRYVNPEVWGDEQLPIMMMVGRNPGENEDIQGKGFIGRAGQKLDTLVQPLLTPQPLVRLIYNNQVKCFTPANREPYDYEVENCRPWLTAEVQEIKPDIVVLLGLQAQAYKFPRKEDRGSMRYDGQTLWTSTYHPSYFLRGGEAGKRAEAETRRTIWQAYYAWQEYKGVEQGVEQGG